MADQKCVKCGKKLRVDNTKGVCGDSVACTKRAAGGGAEDLVLERAGLPKAAPKSDALKRFRVVAEAMGFDPDALLATYCEGWLAAVRQSVEKLEGTAGDE